MPRTLASTLACLALAASIVACDRGGRDTESVEREVAPAAGAPAGDAAQGTSGAVPVPVDPAPSPSAPPAPGTPATVPSPAAPLASNEAAVPRMPVAEAAQREGRGEVVILDVRDAESFQQDHISGSLNIPLGELASRATELPRDKVIVAYCA